MTESPKQPSVFSIERKVWFFQCSTRPTLSAGTLDELGMNLPDLGCEWHQDSWLIIGPENRPFVQAMETALETDGYYLHSSDSNPLDDASFRAAVSALVSQISDDDLS